MNKIKTILIDAEDVIAEYKSVLNQDEGIEVVAEFSNGSEIIKKIQTLNADLIILDILISGTDGFEVISEIKKVSPNTKFIVTSNLNSATVITKAMDMGVDYFMIKPIDAKTLIKRAKEISYVKSNDSSSKKLEEKITNIFLTVGIPAHIKGYQFLREAIKMAVKDPYVINSITKKLYPGIAEQYGTTPSKVERAIRHAIEVAWNKGKIENINDVFGLRVYDTHEKPTNGEFIALVADKMLLEK